MPRSSSSRSSSSKPVSRPALTRNAPAPGPSHHATPPPPAAPRVAAPPPAAAPSAHPPAQPQQSGGMLSGLGATMAQGFAFGTGSAVARQAVNSVFDSFSGDKKESAPAAPQVPQQAPQQKFSGPCGSDQFEFTRCLQENPTNAANCDQYFNALQACQSRN